jgi:RNA polymerase sigma-70 factor (ECF subfamily)
MSNESDRQARFDELASAYGADLYRFAMWICGDDALAKDLVQETYLRAWKALDKLQDIGAAKSWLITILRREYARTFERKVPKFTDVDAVVVPDDNEPEPDDRVEIDLLRRSILTLAPKYREPLLLPVVMGYSCAEISRELGVSKSAVMTQLFRVCWARIPATGIRSSFVLALHRKNSRRRRPRPTGWSPCWIAPWRCPCPTN